MKTIVAALAMHESDYYVIEKAEELAKRTKAKIIYVHAVVTGFFGGRDIDLAKLREELVSFAKKGGDISKNEIEIEISSGWELILKVAKEKSADIVVLGNMSKSRAVLYIGSTAKRVLEKIGIPVFIARSKPLDEKILIPTDLGEYTMKAASVKKFLKSDAPATYIYADTSAFGEIVTPYTTLAAYSAEYIQNEMKKQLELFQTTRTDAPTAVVEVEENVTETIKEYAENNGYTLTVLASRNMSGLNPIIFGSTASKIAQVVDTNLLITFVDE